METSATLSSSPTVAPLFAADFADLESWIEETPRYATVKGMYFDSFLTIAERAGVKRPTEKRYFSFKDYPLRDFMRLNLDTVVQAFPDMSPRDGLRRVGRDAYPTLASTTVGKVLFSVAGRSWERSLSLVQKAWEVSLKPGSIQVAELRSGYARLELHQIWNFVDTYQVGIFEGAMDVFGLRGSVSCEMKSRRCDADLILRWAT